MTTNEKTVKLQHSATPKKENFRRRKLSFHSIKDIDTCKLPNSLVDAILLPSNSYGIWFIPLFHLKKQNALNGINSWYSDRSTIENIEAYSTIMPNTIVKFEIFTARKQFAKREFKREVQRKWIYFEVDILTCGVMFCAVQAVCLCKLFWEYKHWSLDENEFVISNVQLFLTECKCS